MPDMVWGRGRRAVSLHGNTVTRPVCTASAIRVPSLGCVPSLMHPQEHGLLVDELSSTKMKNAVLERQLTLCEAQACHTPPPVCNAPVCNAGSPVTRPGLAVGPSASTRLSPSPDAPSPGPRFFSHLCCSGEGDGERCIEVA